MTVESAFNRNLAIKSNHVALIGIPFKRVRVHSDYKSDFFQCGFSNVDYTGCVKSLLVAFS